MSYNMNTRVGLSRFLSKVPELKLEEEIRHKNYEYLAFKVKNELWENEKGYYSHISDINHSLLICSITGGSKTFTANAMIQGELSTNQKMSPLFIVFDYKSEYPDDHFNYPYLRLDTEGSYGEEFKVKLNPKFFSSAIWSVIFEHTNVRKSKDLHYIVRTMEDEGEDLTDINVIINKYEQYSKELNIAKKEEFKRSIYFLERLPKHKWMDITDPGIKKYLIDTSTNCLILDLSADFHLGEAIAQYFFHQMFELKNLARYYVKNLFNKKISKCKEYNKNYDEKIIIGECIKALKSSSERKLLLDKYSISDDNLHEELFTIYNRKIINVIDEAGDEDFGIARRKASPNVKAQLKNIATRGRYLDINLILMIQNITQIEPLFRTQSAHILIGPIQDTTASEHFSYIVGMPPRKMSEAIDKLGFGQFYLHTKDKDHFVEIISPSEYDINWASDEVHHLVT